MSRLAFAPDAVAEVVDQEWRASGLQPMPHQVDIANAAILEPVLRVVGPPGTGLGRIAPIITAAWGSLTREVAGPASSTLLLAGTGKSARINNRMLGDVRTVHSALGYDPVRQRWGRTPERSIEAGLVILVDSAMLDEATLLALVKACPSSHLVIMAEPQEAALLPNVGRMIFVNSVVRQPLQAVG